MFKDGHKKLGGRKRGSLNSSTKQVKENIQLIIEGNIQQMQDDLKQMQPKDRVNALISLMGFVVPKMKQVENTVDVDFKAIREFDISEIYDSTKE